MIAIGLLVFDILLTLYTWGFLSFFVIKAQWSIIFTLMSICLSYTVASDMSYARKINIMAMHHFFYSASIIFNLAVLLVYWILMHSEIEKQYSKSEPLKYYQMILNHSLP